MSNNIRKLFRFKRKPNQAVSADDSGSGMEISCPTNVKHEFHVGFDQVTGQINGLPPVWEAWLKQSAITYVHDPAFLLKYILNVSTI